VPPAFITTASSEPGTAETAARTDPRLVTCDAQTNDRYHEDTPRVMCGVSQGQVSSGEARHAVAFTVFAATGAVQDCRPSAARPTVRRSTTR